MKFLVDAKRICQRLELLQEMAVHDLKSGYKGTVIGTGWMLIRPAVTILVYYVVFQFFFGLSGETTKAPYAIWFLSGMLPWMYFADTLGSGICCYLEYSYLVKKIFFPVRLIPMIRLLSGYVIHWIFMSFFGVVCIFCNHFRRISLAGLLYAELCLLIHTALVLRQGALIRSFFRDVSDFTGLCLQAGIWTVPVLWEFGKVPESLRWIFAWNPMFHIIQGFRRALGCGREDAAWILSGVIFWAGSLALLLFSEWMYRTLEGYLPDVL